MVRYAVANTPYFCTLFNSHSLYFGENEFFLTRTIKQLKTHTLDQQWTNFNYTEYPPESKETIPQALSDIMTLSLIHI